MTRLDIPIPLMFETESDFARIREFLVSNPHRPDGVDDIQVGWSRADHDTITIELRLGDDSNERDVHNWIEREVLAGGWASKAV